MLTKYDFQGTSDMATVFGKNWCGPENLELYKEVLIAKYEKIKNSDGLAVEVYCTAMPAEFFVIKAIAGKNSIDEPKAGFSIGTGAGSGILSFTVLLAKKINEGMISFEPEKVSQ